MKIGKELMENYEKKLKENEVKEIEIMKINCENRCKKCEKVYNVNVNKAGACGNGSHDAMYQ